MLIKHVIEYILPIKGKLHIPDVIGLPAASRLKPGTHLKCKFQTPTGDEYQTEGKVAFELINYKGRVEDLNRIGGSLIFDTKPGGQVPQGWTLFVLLED